MGITIHYRGTMDDVSQIETLEDRVLDLVFSIGGQATLWRSFAAHDPSRVVRGLMVEMEPGQDTFSLLVSPEGHLTPLFQIEDAEKAPFDEPPYCFVKTQFGSLQGHIAIVHLLDALRQQFCSNLEVSDEGEYYENRDITALIQKMQLLDSAIKSMANGLREYGMNKEAAEDPSILATRIERIAAIVHEKMIAVQDKSIGRTPSQPEFEDWTDPSLEDEVQVMNELRRKNDLRSERMTRRIAEASAAGMSSEEAFELAMEEEGLPIPRRESDEENELDEMVADEPWLESLPEHEFDDASERSRRDRERHPAVEQAQSFLMQVMNLGKSEVKRSSFIPVLMRGSMDMVGGLAQATCHEFDDITHRALAITQLKRSLTGHAFARGALFGLHSEEIISDQTSHILHDQLARILKTIHELSAAAWNEPI